MISEMTGPICVRLSGIVVGRREIVLGEKKFKMLTLSALRTVALRHIYLIYLLHEWNGLNKFGIDQHCCRLAALNGRVTDGRNKCIRFDKLLYLGLTREVISSLIRSLRRVS